jgi:O-antigen/teichoic acid export membrane protein
MNKKINKIIDKTGKYLKTDMKYLLEGGFWLTLGRAGAVITSFLTMMAFSHWVPKEVFGAYQYVLSIVTITGVFTLPGMSNALIRAIAKGKEGMLKLTVKTQVKWSLIGVLGSLAVSGWYFIHQNFLLGKAFLVASFLFPVPKISNRAFDFWKGRKDFKTEAKYSILIKFAEGFLFIPVLFLTDNLVLIIFSYLFTRSFFNFLFLLKTLKEVKNNEKDKITIPLGKHLTLIQVISLIASNLDKVIIWQFLGPIEAASYYFAQTAISKIRPLTGMGYLALPKLSQRNIKKIKKGLLQKFFKSFLFFIPFTSAVILLMPFGFKLFFPQYSRAIPYTQILFLSILLQPINLIKVAFTANNKTKEIYTYNISGNILRIVLFIVLIPLFGIWGAIISILLSEIINSCIVLYLFQKI